MAQITKFGLRVKKTGRLAGLMISSNDGGEFCNSYSAELTNDDTLFLVDRREEAEKVLGDIPWYGRPCSAIGGFQSDRPRSR